MQQYSPSEKLDGGGIQQKANYVFHFSLSSAGKYFIDCSLKHWNTLLTTEKGSGLLFGAILSSVSCPLACKGAGYQIISGQSTLPPEQLSTALVCLCVERKNIFFQPQWKSIQLRIDSVINSPMVIA